MLSFIPRAHCESMGRVTDLQSGEPLEAQIHIIDPNTSVITAVSNTDGENGTYSFYLEKDKKYRIKVFNDNYSNYFFTYNTDYLSSFEKIEKNIELYSKIRLVLNVYDSEIFEPLNADINVFNNSSNETNNILAKPIEKGMYSLHLPIGNVYKIEAENSHFEKDSFILDLSGVVQFSEFERDMELNVKKVDYVFNITDEETGEGVEAVVEIINLSTNEKIIKKVKTDKDGKLKIKLRDGTRYEINITPQGYAFYNTTVDLVDEEANYVTDAKLTPLRKQTKLELNNIYFETNSADLNKASFEELNRLVKLLQNNPQIQIEISAHTDDLGSEVYNLKLSDRRANSVKEYLFAKEISENQIISKGYGESKPAYLPVNTDENRAKNRRVELEVIDVKEE
jgi:outer membrane protein OmpA-like peptidoglycan-associated protein